MIMNILVENFFLLTKGLPIKDVRN